jgi:hypothetical protein
VLALLGREPGAHEELGAARDDGERRAYLVRDAGREAPEGRQSLGVSQLPERVLSSGGFLLKALAERP